MFPSPQWWVLVGEKDTRLSPRGMSSVELLEVDPEEPTLFTVLLAGENTKNSTFLSQCPLGDRTCVFSLSGGSFYQSSPLRGKRYQCETCVEGEKDRTGLVWNGWRKDPHVFLPWGDSIGTRRVDPEECP